MLGLAIYDRGYEEEAEACSLIFQEYARSVGDSLGMIDRLMASFGKSKAPKETSDAAAESYPQDI